MKFGRIVFTLAAIWGFAVTLPLYFLFDVIGRQSPPAINHPEFYYGFAGVTFTWQMVFLLIGRDPRRYRPMMILSVLEKVSYVAAITALFLQQRVAVSQAASGVPDLILAILFLTAFFKTKATAGQPELS